VGDLSGPAELHLETRIEPSGAALISVSGELDVSNAQTLESAVALLTSESTPSELIFDMSGLRFMDSAGIAVLLGAAKKVDKVSLRDPSPIVRRVVELTGLSAVLPVTSR
jgi:stage II sporulation protein AA (anti-sigma F factor antagonist)